MEMVANFGKQMRYAGLIAVFALFAALGSLAVSAQKETAKRKAQVAINLDTKNVSQGQLLEIIRERLGQRKINATEQEMQSAALNTLNLISKEKDPQKGVIYINTKKFTICASWGRHKDFCDSH
jgi:hypothetical protein